MNVEVLLKETKLPELLDRKSMKKILQDNEYGYIPDVPYQVTVSEPKTIEYRYCCGNAEVSRVEFTITTQYGSHSFPVHRLLHTDGSVHPFFVFMNFRGMVPDFYYPVEEIIDRGYNVLSFNYKDVTSDDADFTNGIAGILMPNGQDQTDTCGKLALWAWTASRLMDYAETLPCLDCSQAAVMGHSRLGKTALVAGMMDERFRYVFSNDSGCSGAALARGSLGVMGKTGKYGGTGETIEKIVKAFSYWFCKRYEDFVPTNIPEGFDQHFLVASIAPRFAYVASAAMDEWASPDSEFLSCVAASKAYESLGLTGFVHDGILPDEEATYHAGRVGYHRRTGMHFLSRVDWNRYMDFIDRHHDDVL